MAEVLFLCGSRKGGSSKENYIGLYVFASTRQVDKAVEEFNHITPKEDAESYYLHSIHNILIVHRSSEEKIETVIERL